MSKKLVIIITVDSLRFDIINNPLLWHIKLPYIDNFKMDSVFYKNHYSVGPNTPYSFPGIIASEYPLMYKRGLGLSKSSKSLFGHIKDSLPFVKTTAIISSNMWIDKIFNYSKGIDNFFFVENTGLKYIPDDYTNLGLKSKIKSYFRYNNCLLYTSPSPRDRQKSRMPSSA